MVPGLPELPAQWAANSANRTLLIRLTWIVLGSMDRCRMIESLTADAAAVSPDGWGRHGAPGKYSATTINGIIARHHFRFLSISCFCL